ncbi:uncharacterized protein [Venturia canescens]|uniref:uncharacterized protein isoform X3 n=1 Tax=Venturia canescens TaxID=32260 RepID=UPI001C9CF64B|nr:uncharacterized protein LOC122412149 isoform X3 [Venturia canescens]
MNGNFASAIKSAREEFLVDVSFRQRFLPAHFSAKLFVFLTVFTFTGYKYQVKKSIHRLSLKTEDKLEYQFYPCASGQIQFRIKAPNDAHIALTTEACEGEPMYEVFIGGWGNSKSVIRKNRTKPEVAEADTPGILSNDEFRGFWVRWHENNLAVGKEGESTPFLAYQDSEHLRVGCFGVCTGWGAEGEWLVEARCIGGHGAQTGPAAPSAPAEVSAGSVCWCDASGGMIPPGAVEGGRDDEPLFVGRAHHEGALIPGKVKPSHSVCYVAWGGGEHGKSDYQVLCGCNPRWVPTSGGNIPPNAIPGGESEDGEPLFVGRVEHEGTVTIGKVQQSHNVLYIPFGGTEVAFADYEILVSE